MASRLMMGLAVAAAMALGTMAASAAGLTAAGTGGSSAGAGCTGNEQFSDDFTQADDPAWLDQPRNDIEIGDGKLKATWPKPGEGGWILNQNVSVTDADICFDMSVSPVNDGSQFSGGLAFWVKDGQHYSELLVSPDGWAVLRRFDGDKTINMVNWRKAPSLKTGADAVNSVRVTLKSKKVSVYFNGQPWYTNLSGVPQGEGWGFIFFSEKAAPNTWTFANVKVTDPSQ